MEGREGERDSAPSFKEPDELQNLCECDLAVLVLFFPPKYPSYRSCLAKREVEASGV